MSSEIVVNGIQYVPSKEAATRVGLVADYVSRMCREHLVDGKLINDLWYVNETSLAQFIARTEEEKQQRHARQAQHLRDQRRRADAFARRAARMRHLPQTALLALTITLLLGTAALSLSTPIANSSPALAAVASAFPAPLRASVDRVATSVYNFVCPYFSDCSAQSTLVHATPGTASLSLTQPPATTSATTPPAPRQLPTRTAPTISQPTSPPAGGQPIIERVRETVHTIVQGGISEALLNARLLALTDDLTNRMNQVALAGAYQTNRTYDVLATALRIENLDDVNITNSTWTGGSIAAAAISGTLSNAISSALATISSLTATELVATNATTTNATTTNLYVSGTATLGNGTGVLQSNAGVVSALANGSNGQVLKVVGGSLAWSSDLTGGGGVSNWATTTDDLALYPADASNVVLIGASATTTTGNILEVAGASLLRGTLTAYNTLTAPIFTATSTSATSTFPRLNVTGSLAIGSDYVTDITGSGLSIFSGALTLDTTGDWTGTFDGLEGSAYLANSFSTTSADVWKSNRNFFATTSADYWRSQTDLFATTSSDFWLTQKTTDNLTQGASNKYYSTLLFASDLAGTTTGALAEGSNLYWTNARFDTRLAATTSLPNLTTLTNLSLPAAQLTNFGVPFYSFFSATNTNALAEGSTNKYFTDARADARINATSSIGTLTSAPNLTTLATSLSGFLKATAGVLSAALVDLASDVTGVLGVNHGGTGWASVASAAIPYGNGAGALATTSAGTPGQILALVNGVPTWAATSTLSTITGTLGVAQGGTGLTGTPAFGQILRGTGSGFTLVATSTLGIDLADTVGTLAASRGGTGISNPTAVGILLGTYAGGGWQQLATSSLGLLTTNVAEGSNLYYTDARVQTYLAAQDKGFFFSTTSANAWQTTRNFFATTSADYYKSVNNFFSTTSADYWKTANDFFSTTSASYFLAQNQGAAFATTSSDFWLTQKTTDNLAQGSTNKYYATSLFAADLAGTTTDALAQGSINKYWSNTLFDTRLSATTSLPNITTLANLSLPATQLTNFGVPFYSFFSATNTNALAEGSNNKYFTDARADARINATSSIGTLTSAPSLGTLATSLSGFLKATAGVLTTAFIDLASDVTGILGVNHGGTGWANIASAAIPYGNGSGQLATTTAGQPGQVLAFLNGVPTWAATSTLSTISGTLAVDKGGTGAATFNYGLILSPDGTGALTNIATSSLGLLTTHVAEGSNLYFTDARVQTYLDSVSKGFFFSTTSADAWKNTRNFFSTTSADYFLAQNQGAAFATSSAQFFIHSSSTIPKTYTANSFSGLQTFANASTSVLSASTLCLSTDCRTSWPTAGSSFGYLFPSNATSTTLTFSNGLLALASSTIGNGTQSGGLTISGGATTTGALVVQGTATSTFAGGLQATALNITSTGATSTFANGLNLSAGCFAILGTCLSSGGSSQWTTSGSAIYYSAGNVGVASTSPWALLSVNPNGLTGGAPAFVIGSSTATNFIVTSGGSVGIGKTNPAYTLDVTGDINFTGTLREDGNEIFASMIAPFAGSCPTGWSEYTAARGRSVVGTPSAGTNAATVGTALTDLGTRTVTDVPSHLHAVDPPSTNTNTTGAHTHTTPTSDGTEKKAAGGAFDSTVPSNSDGTTGSGGDHTHTLDIAQFNSGSTGVASVDVTMPYIQLTYCQKAAGADIAEWIPASEDIEKATIISTDPNNREKVIASRTAYDNSVVGVVATQPGWLLGQETKGSVQMALAGRVPMRVSLKNGEIKIGDPITTSSIPGVGMKATKAGPTVGKAMEAVNETSSLTACTDPLTGRAEKCATALVFVNISWYSPTLDESEDTVSPFAGAYTEPLSIGADFKTGDIVALEYRYPQKQGDSAQTEKTGYLMPASAQGYAVGVISTKIGGPGNLLRRKRENNRIVEELRVIESGKAEMNISPSSHAIQVGDPIAVAPNDAGRGSKAETTGFIVARALEAWQPNEGKGAISVMVDSAWWAPPLGAYIGADEQDEGLLGNLVRWLIAWLADTGNGIAKIATRLLAADRVETKELCINETCVSEDELKAMLAASGASALSSPDTSSAAFPANDNSAADPLATSTLDATIDAPAFASSTPDVSEPLSAPEPAKEIIPAEPIDEPTEPPPPQGEPLPPQEQEPLDEAALDEAA